MTYFLFSEVGNKKLFDSQIWNYFDKLNMRNEIVLKEHIQTDRSIFTHSICFRSIESGTGQNGSVRFGGQQLVSWHQ